MSYPGIETQKIRISNMHCECITERKPRRRWPSRPHISIAKLTHRSNTQNFFAKTLTCHICLRYSPKTDIWIPILWRVKSFTLRYDRSCSNRCGSFHINWRSFDANMLTVGVTNMPTWAVITAICKFCDTSPLSLWKRWSRLHHTSESFMWFFLIFAEWNASIRLLIRGLWQAWSFKSEWKIGRESVKLPNSRLISMEFTREDVWATMTCWND